MCRVHVSDPLRHWTQKQWKGKYRTDIKPLKIVQPEVRMEGGGAGAYRCNCTDAKRAAATLLVFAGPFLYSGWEQSRVAELAFSCRLYAHRRPRAAQCWHLRSTA